MAVEKFFGSKDVLVREVGGSLAYGQSAGESTIVQKIGQALMSTEAQADDQKMATFYDIKSEQYPDVPDTMLQEILSDKEKYIPYLAAQLKDLFVEEHREAERKDGNYV